MQIFTQWQYKATPTFNRRSASWTNEVPNRIAGRYRPNVDCYFWNNWSLIMFSYVTTPQLLSLQTILLFSHRPVIYLMLLRWSNMDFVPPYRAKGRNKHRRFGNKRCCAVHRAGETEQEGGNRTTNSCIIRPVYYLYVCTILLEVI